MIKLMKLNITNNNTVYQSIGINDFLKILRKFQQLFFRIIVQTNNPLDDERSKAASSPSIFVSLIVKLASLKKAEKTVLKFMNNSSLYENMNGNKCDLSEPSSQQAIIISKIWTGVIVGVGKKGSQQP